VFIVIVFLTESESLRRGRRLQGSVLLVLARAKPDLEQTAGLLEDQRVLVHLKSLDLVAAWEEEMLSGYRVNP